MSEVQKENDNVKETNCNDLLKFQLGDHIVKAACNGTNVLLANTAREFPRYVIAQADVVILCVALRSLTMCNDEHKRYEQNKTDELESIKCKNNLIKDVTCGTYGIAGGIAGLVVGQMLIPIPIVGPVTGVFIGGFLGSAVGHGQGILIGKIVKVAKKVKEKNAEKTKKEKTNSQSIVKVLAQLVFPHTCEFLASLNGVEKNQFDFDVYLIESSAIKADSVDECSNQILSLLLPMPKET
jgi:hypothetical protein